MPRQIDLFNNNFQVNHNPNNRLSFSSQQVTAMQNQLPNLIAQAEQEAITKILELIDQETGLDLVGLQQWLNELSASLSQSWLNFQNFLNGLAQETDAEVTQALAWLNDQFASVNAAITQINTDVTDIIDSFAPGGTVTEFETGVTNLLAFFGLTPSDIGGATVIDTVWTDVITGIINPLNLIVTDATAWATRLTNDLLILSDVFHLTYQAGSTSDPPGHLGTNGKPTWYSAWNDLLALCGIVNSTTAPSDAAPTVGTALNNTWTSLYGSSAAPASTAQVTAASVASTLGNANLSQDVTSVQGTASGANTNATSALNQLTAVPQQVVVPNLTAGVSSVTFDHAGSGGSATNASGSISTPLTATGTQTVGSTASAVVAAVTYSLVGSGGVQGAAQITVGGQNMQSIGTVQIPSITEYVEFFVLWNPPTGTNLPVSVIAWATGGGVASLSFETSSYIGATNVTAALAFNSGSGTSLSLSVPAALPNTMAVAAFSAGDVTLKLNTAISGYTKTQRGNTTVQVNSGQYGYQSLAYGDSVGAGGGVTFAATGADSSAEWVGAAVVLSATSVVGSGFRAYNCSANSVTAGFGTVGGMFGSTDIVSTPDYSYNSSTGAVAISNAGWYMVVIRYYTNSYTSFKLGTALYHNGSMVQAGNYLVPVSGQIIGDSYLIYCSSGDTLQAGYQAGVSYSATFAADTTGTLAYFEVSLMNRSLL